MLKKTRSARTETEIKKQIELESQFHLWGLVSLLFVSAGMIFLTVLTFEKRGDFRDFPLLEICAILVLLLVLSCSFLIKIFMMRKEWKQLNRRVHFDKLTGVSSWESFEKILEEELRRSARYHYPLVLCRLDLDGFDSFNQHFGHASGNELLQKFGNLLRGTIRVSDVLARYDKDEFCLLLPHTNVVGAEKFISRILLEVTERLDCTFSAGLTPYRAGETKAQWLIRARSALEQAKREGMKRVCCMIGNDGSETLVRF